MVLIRLSEMNDNLIWKTGPDRLLETGAFIVKPLRFVFQ